MHSYIHTCFHTYIHTCFHTYIHTHIHTCVYLNVWFTWRNFWIGSENVNKLSKYIKQAVWWISSDMVHLAVNVDCILCMVFFLELILGFWEEQIEDKSLNLNVRAYTRFMPAAVVCITDGARKPAVLCASPGTKNRRAAACGIAGWPKMAVRR